MSQVLIKASGIIKQKFKSTNGVGAKGNYTKTNFVLLFSDGTEKTFTIFDVLSNDLMRGQTVTFDYVENGKYNTVNGNIVELGGNVAAAPQTVAGPQPPAADPVPATTAKRTYTRKTTAAAAPAATAESVTHQADVEVSGREACRGEAEASVKINLESALALARATGFGNAPLADIVALADMVGRTQTAIFMDSKKDQRMSSFRK